MPSGSRTKRISTASPERPRCRQGSGRTGGQIGLEIQPANALLPAGAAQYAENRALRERMYRAYATRASELGKADWDNGPLMTEILKLRAEEARMLGYHNFAEVSLVPKMADSPQQVLEFLVDLAARAKPFAERDLAELKAFAVGELGLDDMQPWDLAWASEKLKHARYSFSDEEVRQYFPEPKVLSGLFKVIENLYG